VRTPYLREPDHGGEMEQQENTSAFRGRNDKRRGERRYVSRSLDTRDFRDWPPESR